MRPTLGAPFTALPALRGNLGAPCEPVPEGLAIHFQLRHQLIHAFEATLVPNLAVQRRF